MAEVLKEYDLKMDSKRRVTLRSAEYEHYHARHYADGKILLEPRELREPETISRRALEQMDEAIRNLRDGVAGDEFDLAEVDDLINET